MSVRDGSCLAPRPNLCSRKNDYIAFCTGQEDLLNSLFAHCSNMKTENTFENLSIPLDRDVFFRS
jgi:hypothetical protein